MIMRLRVLPAFIGLLLAQTESPAQTMKERTALNGHREAVECVAFSPSGNELASACRGITKDGRDRWGELRLWDVATGKEHMVVRCHKDGIQCVTFSSDGKLAATASSDATVKLWHLTKDKDRVALTERATLKSGLSSIRCLAFSPDGEKLAMANYREVKLWDVAKEQECFAFRTLVNGWSPTFSPDLTTLATPNHQDADLWDITTGKERATLPDHRGLVHQLIFTGDGKTLAVGSHRLGDSGRYSSEVKLWDTATRKERGTIKEVAAFLRDLALSRDGSLLAVQDEQELGGPADLKLLTLPTSRVLNTLSFKGRKDSPRCLAFRPDGKMLVAGCADGSVRLWDLSPP